MALLNLVRHVCQVSGSVSLWISWVQIHQHQLWSRFFPNDDNGETYFQCWFFKLNFWRVVICLNHLTDLLICALIRTFTLLIFVLVYMLTMWKKQLLWRLLVGTGAVFVVGAIKDNEGQACGCKALAFHVATEYSTHPLPTVFLSLL